VVGVLAPKGSGREPAAIRDDLLVVPDAHLHGRLRVPRGLQLNIDAQVAPGGRPWRPYPTSSTETVLRRTHRLNPADSSDFAITSPDDVIKAADQPPRTCSGACSPASR
jgi:hypothetical protein